jgi:hypothetical protein
LFQSLEYFVLAIVSCQKNRPHGLGLWKVWINPGFQELFDEIWIWKKLILVCLIWFWDWPCQALDSCSKAIYAINRHICVQLVD